MELLDLIHKDMLLGFDGLNRRLDMLNGQVRKHGEEIAVLKNQHASFLEDLADIDRHVSEHQILCPAIQDLNGMKRADFRRSSIIAGTASVLTAIILEWGPHLYEFFKWIIS